MSKRKSVHYLQNMASRRLEDLTAIGQSRHEAKEAQRAAAEGSSAKAPFLAPSTGKIHSYGTWRTYDQQARQYVCWVREQRLAGTMAELDGCADELVCTYLQALLDAGKRPYTLTTVRSALRLFYRPVLGLEAAHLGDDVAIPPRHREEITRSRQPVAMDARLDRAAHAPLIAFLEGCGLRRREVASLRCRDVWEEPSGSAWVHVRNGKGGKERDVAVVPGREADVLGVVPGRPLAERVFAGIPDALDVHALRRTYAQAAYLAELARQGRSEMGLPPAHGRLPPGCYDEDAALRVSHWLGHNRVDVMLRHYLR